ncbi:MAG: hypothetical protein K8R35_04980 [Bacteroidales bacterium]|nr:hypothetical protein [Bacteroidales bacterium]
MNKQKLKTKNSKFELQNKFIRKANELQNGSSDNCIYFEDILNYLLEDYDVYIDDNMIGLQESDNLRVVGIGERDEDKLGELFKMLQKFKDIYLFLKEEKFFEIAEGRRERGRSYGNKALLKRKDTFSTFSAMPTNLQKFLRDNSMKFKCVLKKDINDLIDLDLYPNSLIKEAQGERRRLLERKVDLLWTILIAFITYVLGIITML